ncbi:MAG TPA: helix-hairpin-helix domain-containing protein [Vicinamibacterales bacterium]|nr:helix-hairpin-helix domain-containing protein [Vicinamibacterales bacterium]
MIRLLTCLIACMPLMAGTLSAQSGASKPDASPSPSAKASAKPAAPAAIVNLNTATQQELETLPGIGARTAERIIEYRTKKGPFKKIEELMNVQGIGEKSFLKLKPQLTVAAKADTNQ